MAHFYGNIRGQRGNASRLGSKASGLSTMTASWQGAVSVILYEQDGIDMAEVALIPWRGTGTHVELYRGPVSGAGEFTTQLDKHPATLPEKQLTECLMCGQGIPDAKGA